MSLANPWKSYRQIATQTAPPGQLVLMLYDGVIRFLDRALTGFEKDDVAEAYETISNNVLRAQEIIRELSVSLNLNEGGEFAVKMQALYEYFDRRLQESNLKKEDAGIREVVKRVTVLRDAWSCMLRGETDMPGYVTPSAKGQRLVAA